jgi:hypothetical protein
MTPGSGMGKKSKSRSGMNIPDDISENLETTFVLKLQKFYDVDPGSGILQTPGSRIENIRIQDNHPVSATLYITVPFSHFAN